MGGSSTRSLNVVGGFVRGEKSFCFVFRLHLAVLGYYSQFFAPGSLLRDQVVLRIERAILSAS